MNLDHVLTTTRTVRRRLDVERPVEREVVEECLKLALQAPNGSNLQLWRWILVDDPQLRSAMADIYRTGLAKAKTMRGLQNRDSRVSGRMGESVDHLADVLHRVPVLVVPLMSGTPSGASTFGQANFWGSLFPAVWSCMLALRARGLGTAWTTVHLLEQEQMAELLGIPSGYTQAGLFPIAYTIGTDFRTASRRPVSEVASWNGFGAL